MSKKIIRAYYRISDNSYKKPKLPGASKEMCFGSFVNAFPEFRGDRLTVIADRCTEETLHMLWGFTPNVIETDLGNAGSLRRAIYEATTTNHKDDWVYFSEDDYLYRKGADEVLREGIELADYVTLYDHPDKYTSAYGGEISRVVKTKNSHWRYTISTCMTFGSQVKTLIADDYFWEEHTKGSHPNDHQVFADLNGAGRSLAVPIPGLACHTDLTFSGEVNHVLMETWAIDHLCEILKASLLLNADEMIKNVVEASTEKVDGFNKLVMLDALAYANKKAQV